MKGRDFGHDIRTKAAASGRGVYDIGLRGRAVGGGLDWRSCKGIRVKGHRFPQAAVAKPNIFLYNLDDLRDAFPGGIDPLQYMPKTRQWLSGGQRFTQSFVADPSCCPSRASMMTGRYPHNNGVLHQHDATNFDGPHSMACYLRSAGYATYLSGKFLNNWPATTLPPCFDHSTVLSGGYTNVTVRVDGAWRSTSGYSTTYLGTRGREYITQSLSAGSPFLLYEAPHAPHWSEVTRPDGTIARLAIPSSKYRVHVRRKLCRRTGGGSQ